MTAKPASIAAALAERRHDPIENTGHWLRQTVRGYVNYHAVPGNLRRFDILRLETAALAVLAEEAKSAQRVKTFMGRFLTGPEVPHAYPMEWSCAKRPGSEAVCVSVRGASQRP